MPSYEQAPGFISCPTTQVLRQAWHIGLHSGHVLPVMAGPARRPAGVSEHHGSGWGRWLRTGAEGPGWPLQGSVRGQAGLNEGLLLFACLN